MPDTTAEQPPKCSYPDCNLETYQNHDKCILHCEKSDSFNTEDERVFYQQLKNLIAKNDKRETLHGNDFPPKYFGQNYDKSTKIIEIIEINFPKPVNDSSNFNKLLKTIKRVEFINCQFLFPVEHTTSFTIQFSNCTFWDEVAINNAKTEQVIENETVYDKCVFKKHVHITITGEIFRNKVLFRCCEFDNEVVFQDCSVFFIPFVSSDIKTVSFNKCIFDVEPFSQIYKRGNQQIPELVISECTFNEIVLLNPIEQLISIQIEDSVFNKAFYMSGIAIYSNILITNSSFSDLFEVKSSRLNHFSVINSVFKSVVSFEETVFRKVDEADTAAIFSNVTFSNYLNMKKTKFLTGLDFSDVSYSYPPVFLKTEISSKNTDRETYRIIKHSFDSVGNHIEGNKYFAEEMRVYREELQKTNDYAKRIAMFVNYYTSNFGQNYVCPIVLIFITIFIHSLLYYGYSNDICFPPPACLWSGLNYMFSTALSILPFFRPERGNEGFATLAFIFYITYSVLIYQLIIALKRLTRR